MITPLKKKVPAEVLLVKAMMAVEMDGAEASIGYCIIDHLREQLDVPVISPVQSAVRVAETLVRLNLSQSKRAFPNPLGQ